MLSSAWHTLHASRHSQKSGRKKPQQYHWNCLNLGTASKIMSLLLYFLISLRWHLNAGIRTTSWTMVKYWIPTSMSLLPYIFQASTAGQVPCHNTLACLSHLAESVKRCVVFYLFLGPRIKMDTRFQTLQFAKWWSLSALAPEWLCGAEHIPQPWPMPIPCGPLKNR